MADSIFIKLSGDEDVIASFRQLSSDISERFAARAVHKSAERMRIDILSRVPIDTGKLFNNIVIKIRRTAQTVRARVVVNTLGKGGDPNNAFYWRFIEFGHRVRGGGDSRVAPQPFVTPSFEAGKNDAAQDVVDEVSEAIKRAEARANRLAVSAARYL